MQLKRSNNIKAFWIYIYSRDEDISRYRLLIQCLGRHFFVQLPDWLRGSQVPSDPYWVLRHEYGFSITEYVFSVSWGYQNGGSETSQRKTWAIPWAFKLVEHHLLYPDGTYFAKHNWSYGQELFCPKLNYKVQDIDGWERWMTVSLEQEKYVRGSGWFKWLRRFTKPRIRRFAWIAYVSDNEHKPKICRGSIDLLPNESILKLIERDCLTRGETIIDLAIQSSEGSHVSIGS